MKGGLIDANHPLATGINPETGEKIWMKNLLYASERKREFAASDEEIVHAVAGHAMKMIQKSVSTAENPFGVPDRMPPAINYIHGGIHYNGGFIILDDLRDAYRHFSDPKFRRIFLKFIYYEKREPITIIRDRNYDRQELLNFVCFLRTMFPYFSNSNGNKKKIGWGNPAPYISINSITGFWKNDTYKFYNKNKIESIARSPITTNYFPEGSYHGERDHALWPEKFLANFTNDRVIARGAKGNIFFVDLRKIKKGFRFDGGNLPSLIQRLPEKLFSKA